MRALAGIAATVWLAIAADAHAVTLCRAKKGGALFARETCRKNETAVPAAQLGVPGTPGASGAVGPSRAALYLVDSAGVEVGPVVFVNPFPVLVAGPQAYALVRADAVGGAALLTVAELGEPVGDVFHTNADCTDPGFVDGKTLTPLLQVIGDTVHRPVTTAGPVGIAALERSDPSQGCTSVTPRGGCCQQVTPHSRDDLSTVATTSLAGLGFTPPFHLTGP